VAHKGVDQNGGTLCEKGGDWTEWLSFGNLGGNAPCEQRTRSELHIRVEMKPK